jgi:hypothetical protein
VIAISGLLREFFDFVLTPDYMHPACQTPGVRHEKCNALKNIQLQEIPGFGLELGNSRFGLKIYLCGGIF